VVFGFCGWRFEGRAGSESRLVGFGERGCGSRVVRYFDEEYGCTCCHEVHGILCEIEEL